MNDNERAEDAKRASAHVDRVLAQLSEHFDTVQIIATQYHPGPRGETRWVNGGIGNYYARCGSVRMWLVQQERRAQTAADAEDEREDYT